MFILFESTYIDAVFVIKILVGSHIVLKGERLNNAKNSSFHETLFVTVHGKTYFNAYPLNGQKLTGS